MKPNVNKNKEIRKSKFKYAWYKAFVRLLRNKKRKNFRDDNTIHLS